MFRPNLFTIILSAILGVFASVFAVLHPIMIAVYFIIFIIMVLFRTRNFWLVIFSFLINIFVFLLQFGYKNGITSIQFGQSYVFSLMAVSTVAIVIYTFLGVLQWKNELY